MALVLVRYMEENHHSSEAQRQREEVEKRQKAVDRREQLRRKRTFREELKKINGFKTFKYYCLQPQPLRVRLNNQALPHRRSVPRLPSC